MCIRDSGYYIPDSVEDGDTYEPVYRITGTLFGVTEEGEPVEGELLWYEPAIDGRSINALNIDPIH